MIRRPTDSGQASVEFVALLPLIGLVGALLVQATLFGWAQWSAGGAARAAARAHALGSPTLVAARAAVPERLRPAVQVRTRMDAVEVRVRVPRLVPGIAAGTVTARSRFPAQDQGG